MKAMGVEVGRIDVAEFVHHIGRCLWAEGVCVCNFNSVTPPHLKAVK